MNRLITLAVHVPVGRPVRECWATLEDLHLAHNYVPGLTGTEIVSASTRGEGTHRRVYTGERYLEETVTEWCEGRGFTLRLHRGDKPMSPFKEASFAYRLAPLDEDRTAVTLSMVVALPGAAIGHWLGSALLGPVMQRQLRLVAAGLKHFYETGEPAGDDDRKRLLGAVRDGPGPT